MSIVLTCNAGSSNTKLAAFDIKTGERKGHTITHSSTETLGWICSIGTYGIKAVGHRIVHGGREFSQPIIIDDNVLDKLEAFIPLAPLHQPASLKLIEEARKLYPNVPHIACFDTAFHHTLPEVERRLPLPRWYHNQGIMRYGFHGLSYQHIATVLPEFAGVQANGNIIVAHLGSGSSACALKDRRSIATTMGFSTLDGLMMSTRSGAIDPGVIIYLQKELGMHPHEIDRLLYLESGLQGVSGISSDMRQLLASEEPEAWEAVELYCYLAAKQMASLLPVLGGLDAIVFTGGIGENNAVIRENIVDRLRWLGNFSVYVIPTDEEAVIKDACCAFLA